MKRGEDNPHAHREVGWTRCCFCGGSLLALHNHNEESVARCVCIPEEVRVIHHRILSGSYPPATPEQDVSVYVAGSVIEPVDQNEAGGDGRVLQWREEIFIGPSADSGSCGSLQAGGHSFGRFRYAGPTVVAGHGYGSHELAKNCLDEVSKSDVLFAWIDREDTIGTMVEIGAAHSLQKPIFVAFANRGLAKRFYFAKQLAAVAMTAPDALAAWKMFVRWRDQEDAYTNPPDAAARQSNLGDEKTALSAIGVLVGRKTIRTPRSQVDLTLEIRKLPGGLLALDVEAEDGIVAELSDLPDFLPSTKHVVRTNKGGKRQHRFIYKDPNLKLP